MDQLATLELAHGELRREVQLLAEPDLETVSNCDPWTIRRLASHALNNQLFWAGMVTGVQIVTVEDVMGATPYDGDLAAYADEVPQRAQAMWATDGVLAALHATPFGELPGSVVINFAIIDALCHAWDLSASLGRPLQFPAHSIPAVTAVVEATCTDDVRALGLIAGIAQTAPDANDTTRLMAQAGRSHPVA